MNSTEPALPRSSGWLAKLTAIVLTTLNLLLGFALIGHRGLDRWGEVIGGTAAPVLVALFVVLVSRPFSSTRVSLSPVRVYNWTLLFLLFSSVAQLFQRVGQTL